MEIRRFESEEHLNAFINNKDYKEKKGKIRTFDDREYVKFGSLIEKHGKLWKVGRFFKVLALTLPSICSLKFRKNIRRTWKEFKTGMQTTASLYVQRQLEIGNDPIVQPAPVVINNPIIEPNQAPVIKQALNILELKELLNKKDRDQEASEKLIEDIKNLNTERLSDLVVFVVRLNLGELLELVSLRDKIEFSNVFLDAAKIRIEQALNDGLSFLVADLSLTRFQALHSFFPFHPFFVNKWLFLNVNTEKFFALTHYIFSFPLNEIPVDYLNTYLNTLPFNGYSDFDKDIFKKEEIEKLRVILSKSSQGINLSTIPTKNLELFLKFAHACGSFIPEVSSLSKEKMNAIIVNQRYTASNIWLIGNLLRMIPNVEERKLQLKNFLSIDSFNYIWFFERKIKDTKTDCQKAKDAFKNAAGGSSERVLELSNAYKKAKDNYEGQLKDLESAYVDVLMTCEDLSDASSQKIFKDLLSLLTSTFDKPENTKVIKEKIVERMSASQAVHLLNDHNFENFGFSRIAIIHAIASDEAKLSKFIELSQERDLAKCLGQFGYATATSLNVTMRTVLNELLKQNKLVSVIDAMNSYNYSSYLINSLDIQTLKNFFKLFIQKARDTNQNYEKSCQIEKIERVFDLLAQELKSLPNNLGQISDIEVGKKFIECWNEIIQTYPDMASTALKGFVVGMFRGEYKSQLNQNKFTRLVGFIQGILANNTQLKEEYDQFYADRFNSIY